MQTVVLVYSLRIPYLNLTPIEELLTSGIAPQDLANELDEILFDYVFMFTNLLLKQEENEDFLHDKIPDYIFRLKELKDVLMKC